MPEPCPHLIVQVILEEQPYFDCDFQEIDYRPGSYYCLDCLETIYFVDGHWFTQLEMENYNKDIDSIPF